MPCWRSHTRATSFGPRRAQLLFPTTFNLDGLESFSFGAEAGGTGGGFDVAGHINSRARVNPAPWRGDVTFASTMTVRGFAISFELTLNQPTLTTRGSGLGLMFHQMVLNFRISVPYMRLERVTFEVPDDYACNSVYTIPLCVAHNVAEGVFRDVMRGVFNGIMERGLDQFNPSCSGCFIDTAVDLTAVINEGLNDVSINSAAVDAICGLVNGCGGKTVADLVGGSRTWIMIMMFMFAVFFTSIGCVCCGCCMRASAKPRPPSAITKAHQALSKHRKVTLTIIKAPNPAWSTVGLSFRNVSGQITVVSVETGSEADAAGVIVDDKLMALNGKVVTSTAYATNAINGANQVLNCEFRREPTIRVIRLIKQSAADDDFGCIFASNGAIESVEPGMAADIGGVQVGDRILTVNNVDVRSNNVDALGPQVLIDAGGEVKLTIARKASPDDPVDDVEMVEMSATASVAGSVPVAQGQAVVPQAAVPVSQVTLSAQVTPEFCTACGARLTPGAVFCENCGHRVEYGLLA